MDPRLKMLNTASTKNHPWGFHSLIPSQHTPVQHVLSVSWPTGSHSHPCFTSGRYLREILLTGLVWKISLKAYLSDWSEMKFPVRDVMRKTRWAKASGDSLLVRCLLKYRECSCFHNDETWTDRFFLLSHLSQHASKLKQRMSSNIRIWVKASFPPAKFLAGLMIEKFNSCPPGYSAISTSRQKAEKSKHFGEQHFQHYQTK